MTQQGSDSGNSSPETKHLEMKIDYLKMRLDHTLTHLQTASKLIYLVDGAVLAFVYFLVNAFTLSRSIALFVSIISTVLAGINFIHSRFILTQQHWYRKIDERIRELLGEDQLEPIPKNKFTKGLFTSSHRNLKHVHVLIAVSLLLVAVFLLLYALGRFDEIQMRTTKP